MKSTNLQLIKELNMLKQNMAMFTMPTKFEEKRYHSSLAEGGLSGFGGGGGGATALSTVRSAIENTYQSFKSK